MFSWNAIWIFVGGGLGSLARWGASSWVAQRYGEAFWGTFCVNVVGSFLIGIFAALSGPEGRISSSAVFRDFFIIGLCGGFTTFSSFSIQTLALAQAGEWTKAGINVVLSVVVCLIAVWLGHLFGSLFAPRTLA